ncbi:radical SAM protein, partial [Candidatus Dojkabacteria bacterium]|nr:radical SAM protein [Candidatus Dojkabacteria bacterium]
MSIEMGIRQDDTWIAVDPVVGCAKNCQYCFLQIYGATPKAGEILLSPDEAIDNLMNFETYSPGSTIMIGSETDVFMSKTNINYFTEFIKRYDEREIGNPVAFVTKCHIPDNFIEMVDNLQNTKVIYYLSYSGLSKPIEPTTNIERLRQNFVRLHEAGQDIIHYWRPFLPQNSSHEKIQEVIDHAAKYAKCTVAAGIKLNPGILSNVKEYWPELAKANIDFNQVAAVWPEGVRDYLLNYVVKTYPHYPLYWVN